MLQFIVAVLPLCFKPRLAELRHVSLIVVAYCTFVSLCLVGRSAVLASEHGVHNADPFKPVSFNAVLTNAPVACFGFSMIGEVFAVRSEAKDRATNGRYIHIATVIVTAVYFFVGFVGALAFETPSDNVLLSFLDERFFKILMFFLTILIGLLYPIINFPAVAAIDAMFAGREGQSSQRRRNIATLFMVVVVVVIDSTVTNLGLLFGLAGSIGLGLLAYVLPVSAYLRLALSGRYPMLKSAPKVAMALLTLAITLFMVIVASAQIIYQAATA